MGNGENPLKKSQGQEEIVGNFGLNICPVKEGTVHMQPQWNNDLEREG